MKKRIVITKVFAVDEKGNPIEYLAYEVPALRKLLTNGLHHLLIRLPLASAFGDDMVI
jgi:hypothetical protein